MYIGIGKQYALLDDWLHDLLHNLGRIFKKSPQQLTLSVYSPCRWF